MKAVGKEMATLGGGCFWCLEAVYVELRGVEQVVSGYSGGDAPNPSYEAVASDTTGHAEVVQVTFDPTAITYRDLLDVFFTIHDPTTLNRQGNDVGHSYRSIILYHSPQQEATARNVIEELQRARVYRSPIVTAVTPFKVFHEAEEYHQNYYANNPNQGYCRLIIAPKVAKLRSKYLAKLLKA